AMEIERQGVDTYVSSICRPDWTDAIQAIADKIGSRLGSACFARALDFTLAEDPADPADRDCSADCRVVETYGGSDASRPCMILPGEDNCICGPTTAADFYPPPCKIAGTETPCEPFKRDLGCIGGPCPGSGDPPYGRRQCLVRQAPRTFDGSRCSAAARPGWYYVPKGMFRDEPGCGDPPCVDPPCHQLVLEVSGLAIIEDGSSADLRCLAFLCPESRQCGTSEHPTAGCCARGHRGTTGVGRTMGECRPESCPAGQTPAAVQCSTAGETAGRCE
ncbi:MAG: hypothetical protein QME96_13390, partial [Myxococcota bacterium]|nr:hypothetical protein [Myxococcota bacterium]